MKLEINKSYIKDSLVEKLENRGILITPPIGTKDYWLFKVRVHKNQSIVGFPKFSTIGIGFEHEDDWNTNLPYTMEATEIYEHIRHNKKYKSIKRQKCIDAIRTIQQAIRQESM